MTPRGRLPTLLRKIAKDIGLTAEQPWGAQSVNGLFRFPEAIRRDPAIDAWLDKQVPELGAIARRWFGRMRKCGPGVRELMHDGCPTACVGDAAFGYVAVFRHHTNVGFFLGAELHDPMGLLEGTGKRMRHVKMRPRADVVDEAVDALISSAYADIRLRLARLTSGPGVRPR